MPAFWANGAGARKKFGVVVFGLQPRLSGGVWRAVVRAHDGGCTLEACDVRIADLAEATACLVDQQIDELLGCCRSTGGDRVHHGAADEHEIRARGQRLDDVLARTHPT